MKKRINPKEADNIIRALEGGVVPSRGIQHLLVGRNDEVSEVITILDSISEGNSDIRFWAGDFGSGKSFMLSTITSLALQKNFVVSSVDLTPTRRFYATDGKAKALYSEVVDSLKIQTAQDGNALQVIIDKWISTLMDKVAKQNDITLLEVLNMDYYDEMENLILDTVSKFRATGLSFELGQAICKYYEGMIKNDRLLKIMALRWIRGDIETKTESKRELKIDRIINDDNWYEGIKSLAELFVNIDYEGFVINFDEAVNLYKLPMARTRERNYEKILNIFNECKTNKAIGLYINFGATRKTIFDEYRGLSSYGALKGRLGIEERMDSKLVNTNRSVLPLKPLSDEDIYILLDNLVNIFNVHYKTDIVLSSEEIQLYMMQQLNRPGAKEFLTPRAVIKDYIEILDLIRQNPEVEISDVILEKFGKSATPIVKDEEDDDDDLEVF